MPSDICQKCGRLREVWEESYPNGICEGCWEEVADRIFAEMKQAEPPPPPQRPGFYLIPKAPKKVALEILFWFVALLLFLGVLKLAGVF